MSHVHAIKSETRMWCGVRLSFRTAYTGSPEAATCPKCLAAIAKAQEPNP